MGVVISRVTAGGVLGGAAARTGYGHPLSESIMERPAHISGRLILAFNRGSTALNYETDEPGVFLPGLIPGAENTHIALIFSR
jgi:hypothetical protein